MDKNSNNKTIKICPCGKKFSVVPSRLRLKYCSRRCYYKYGIDNKGEKSGKWVGDNIGKLGLHDWIEREKGKAKYLYCAKADEGTCKGRLEWSNKSQKYKRDLEDWWALCGSHHRKYDREMNGKNYKPNKGEFEKGIIPWNKGKKGIQKVSEETKRKISKTLKIKFKNNLLTPWNKQKKKK